MDLVEIMGYVAGVLSLIAFIVLTNIQGIKNLYLIINKPIDYIKINHGGVLEEILERHFGEKIKEVVDSSIVETLSDTGIYRVLDENKSIYSILTKNFIDSEIKKNSADYRSRLIHIIQKNSKNIPSKVGLKSPSNYEYYINLRSILPNSAEATMLSYILTGFILDSIENDNKRYDFIAVNRNGNSILGYLISNFLSLPLVIVNYDSRWELGGKKVDIDGLSEIRRPSNKRGFLVDDAVSGGSILKESCSILRKNGLQIDDVYVLFTRKEDDAISDYKNDSINLHSIFDLDDKAICKIIEAKPENLESMANEI
ncbi:MAG: hypothetical protein MJK12_03030 [Colwellia sp.]|nr:hypothetical protein [Colwellia sp.]